MKHISIRNVLSCVIPAFFFAVFMILGHSFYEDNSWDLVFGSTELFRSSVLHGIGYFILFSVSIALLFHGLDRLSRKHYNERTWPKPIQFYLELLHRHPIATTFFTLFLLYLPYMIYSFPGIFTSDTVAQLENGYVALFEKTSRLRNHHPVVHTLLLYGFSRFGATVFHSPTIGIGLFSLIQICFLFFVIGWMIQFLLERHVSARCLGLVLLFYVLSPRMRNYMFLLVKDTWFAGFLLLFLVELYRILTIQNWSSAEKWQHRGMFLLSILGIFFFRQEGVYLIILSSLVMLIATRRRSFLRLAVLAFAGFYLYTQILLPACSVKASNPREVFSIPFQQTARYLRDAGDDVTPEEKEAISAILDYDNLAERYNPNLSDPVKATYNTDAGSDELLSYFEAWFQMLLRHPDIYVQATMNNLYGYFYPGGFTTKLYSYDNSETHLEELNESLADDGVSFHYPAAFDAVRQNLETLRESIFQLPGLVLFNYTATYIWMLILWFFYCIRRKNQKGLLLLTPLMIVLLVCIAGPTYGWYFRYAYSIAFCLPAVILTSWSEYRQ